MIFSFFVAFVACKVKATSISVVTGFTTQITSLFFYCWSWAWLRGWVIVAVVWIIVGVEAVTVAIKTFRLSCIVDAVVVIIIIVVIGVTIRVYVTIIVVVVAVVKTWVLVLVKSRIRFTNSVIMLLVWVLIACCHEWAGCM